MRQADALSRRCVIKVRYVQMSATSRTLVERHLATSNGMVWSAMDRRGCSTEPTRNSEWSNFASSSKTSSGQFRFTMSPEDGDQLDLTEFARQFMRQSRRPRAAAI